MATTLSIINGRTSSDNLWNRKLGNPYGSDDILKIEDNIGEINIPVTSIPSPIAQMHLYDIAFKVVSTEEGGRQKEGNGLDGNSTFHKIISDCLDVYELLFSAGMLGHMGKIDIYLWEDKQLEALKNSSEEGRKVFGESLDIFLKGYNNESRFKQVEEEESLFSKLYLFRIGHEIIAGTSPYTGFFKSGNEIEVELKNAEGRPFFKGKPVPLFKRDTTFLNFLYEFVFGTPRLSRCFSSLREYLRKCADYIESTKDKSRIKSIINGDKVNIDKYALYKDGNTTLEIIPGVPFRYFKESDDELKYLIEKSDYRLNCSRVVERLPLILLKGHKQPNWRFVKGPMPEDLDFEENPSTRIEERKLPGFGDFNYPWIVRNDLLTKGLIKLNYNLNDDRFWAPNIKEEISILPPVTPLYFKFFTLEDLKKQLSVKCYSNRIDIMLKLPVMAKGGQEYIEFKRSYSQLEGEAFLEGNEEKGAIREVEAFIGIYPFFKITDSSKEHYNDLYKVAVYRAEETPIPTINCYRYQELETPLDIHWTERSVGSDSFTFTKYGTLSREAKKDRPIDFDLIQMVIGSQEKSFSGLLIPRWKEISSLSSSESTIAFDIGTSNTYVAYSSNGNSNIKPLRSYVSDQNKILSGVAFSHKTKGDNFVASKGTELDFNAYVGEHGTDFLDHQLTEFLPSLFGEGSDYSFPIPTIINEDADLDASELDNLDILSNINVPIAFDVSGFRKGIDRPSSNLKWGIAKGDRTAKNRMFALIYQLALMGRNQLLLEGADPENTRLVWFKPLSMGARSLNILSEHWQRVFELFYIKKTGVTHNNLYQITESRAPFHSQEAKFGKSETYLNIDIGGGTSDVLVFKNENIVLSSSFRFAGNNLFDNGIQKHDRKENGFILKFKPILDSRSGSFNRAIADQIFKSDYLSSADLISHYFSHKEFEEELKLDNDFRLLFLIHLSAIFYHTAQLLKIKGIAIPKGIGLSGNSSKFTFIANGSKDLNRSEGLANLFSRIFNHVYQGNDKTNSANLQTISIDILENPKVATCHGGILGLDEMTVEDQIEADQVNFYIPVGDSEQIVREKDRTTRLENFSYQKLLDQNNPTRAKVAKNYLGFIEFFFNKLWVEADIPNNFAINKELDRKKLLAFFSKENEISSALTTFITRMQKNEGEESITESMFFYPLRPHLYELSRVLAKNPAELKS